MLSPSKGVAFTVTMPGRELPAMPGSKNSLCPRHRQQIERAMSYIDTRGEQLCINLQTDI